jgi:hypothetical protein
MKSIKQRDALNVQRTEPCTTSNSAAGSIEDPACLPVAVVAHSKVSNAARVNTAVLLSALNQPLHNQSCSTTDAVHAHVSRMHLRMHRTHAEHSGTACT